MAWPDPPSCSTPLPARAAWMRFDTRSANKFGGVRYKSPNLPCITRSSPTLTARPFKPPNKPPCLPTKAAWTVSIVRGYLQSSRDAETVSCRVTIASGSIEGARSVFSTSPPSMDPHDLAIASSLSPSCGRPDRPWPSSAGGRARAPRGRVRPASQRRRDTLLDLP